MPACASTRAAPAARRAISTSGRERETQDLYQCVEWAGTQPWSNGKVGINGISYYAMNQWTVGALRPPHLAALCIWEGSSDYYRELCRHGGILSDFLNSWYPRQVASVQHGVGDARRKERRDRRTAWPGPKRCRKKSSPRIAADTPGEAETPRGLSTTTTAARTAEFREDRGAAALRRQLGRHGPAHARQFRRLAARRLEAEMARGARRHALHAFLQPLRRGAAESDSSAISSKARIPAGTSSRACRSTSAIPARNSCCAPRTNGRSRARNGRNISCSRTRMTLSPDAPSQAATLSL